MAKDPAINWYFDNWDGGTKLLTRHQKGCYIDLLSTQFHCGHLTIENIKNILGPDFAEWDKCLKVKFEIDEKGMFFNERIEREISKRESYSERGKKGGNPNFKKGLRNPYYEDKDKLKDKLSHKLKDNLQHKLTGIGTETEIGVIGGMGGEGDSPPGFQSELAILPIAELANKVYQDGTMEAVAARCFLPSTKDGIKMLLSAFIDHLTATGVKEKSERGFRSHFTNWLRKQNAADYKPKKDLTTQYTTTDELRAKYGRK